MTLVLNDLVERHPPTLLPRLEDGSGEQRGTSHVHGSNLLSGWHKGDVRGQISAVRGRCFLMVMPSQTTLHHSKAVREEWPVHWMGAFMNMMLGIMIHEDLQDVLRK